MAHGESWIVQRVLDFVKQVRLHELDVFLIVDGIEEPGGGGDAAEQGIAILRGEAEAGDFMSVADCNGRS